MVDAWTIMVGPWMAMAYAMDLAWMGNGTCEAME